MSTVGETTAESDAIMVASFNPETSLATSGFEMPSLATPSFVVGPDAEGHWLAVETHGKGGGIFVSREAAIGYARSESCHRPGCVALASSPITLS